jgi:ParB-like chromosome segregation protein Spo0J
MVPRMTAELSARIEVAPSELGESLATLRLCAPEAQQHMQLSLSRLGQLSPVLAYRLGDNLEIFDGIKRVRAARALSWPVLRVEVHTLDVPGAKVRLLLANQSAGLSELEEAWLVRSLYREDKLSQPQIAQLLSRHKSWVCRRLALAEDLSDELTANVRLGLVSATAARELARVARGHPHPRGPGV